MAEHLVAILQFQRSAQPRRIGVHLQRPFRQLRTERRQFGNRRRRVRSPAASAVAGSTNWLTRPRRSASAAEHRPARHHPVGGHTRSDDPGQVVTHAHLGAGQPQQDRTVAERRRRRADPDVGRQAQREARPDTRSVHRGDDGLSADSGSPAAVRPSLPGTASGRSQDRTPRVPAARSCARRYPSRSRGPLPVITTAWTDASVPKAANVSINSSRIASLIALSCLGRFSCSTTTPAWGRSTISVSVTFSAAADRAPAAR